MIQVQTFFRSRDGSFLPVEVAKEIPPDLDYIEGAIELTVNGIPILTKQEWDYVDQLWAYLARMLNRLTDGAADAETDFPDQPIHVLFSRKSGKVLRISCKYNSVFRKADADYEEFVQALKMGGLTFFERLVEMIPQNAEHYESAISMLRS